MLANLRFLLRRWWLSLLIRNPMAELALRFVTTLPLMSPVVLTLVVPPSVLRRVPLTALFPLLPFLLYGLMVRSSTLHFNVNE